MPPTTAPPTGSAPCALPVEDALDDLTAVVDRLTRLDVDRLDERAVTRALRRIARAHGRLEGVQARLVAAAARSGVPDRAGAPSTTAWVAQQTGRSGQQAARTGRLAKATATNPELTEAVATGRVGPDQAARLATGLDRGTMDPVDADHLLRSAADLPPAQFNRAAKRLEGRRHQRRLREREQAAHEARAVRTWRDDDEALHVEARLAPAHGDVVQKALQAFVRPDGAEVPDHLRRTHAQLLADAMVDLCRTVLDRGLAGDVGGVRPHVTVAATIDAMAALDDAEAAGAVAITDLGTSLSAAAFQRLACDATFRRLVVTPEGRPVDVGRATRKWSSSQRAALVAADGGCRGPGCDLAPDRCEAHHVTWWRDGGTTGVDNGALLCGHHHDLVHEPGWTLALDASTRHCTWTAPDGTVVVTRPHGLTAPSTTDDRGPGHEPTVARGRRATTEARHRVHLAAPPGPRPPRRPRRPGGRTRETDADPPAPLRLDL